MQKHGQTATPYRDRQRCELLTPSTRWQDAELAILIATGPHRIICRKAYPDTPSPGSAETKVGSR